MVLVVTGLRRLLRPRLSDESAGIQLRGSRADPHGGHGRLETAAPCRDATFVIALGYSLIIPVMPFYMKNLGAGGKELGWLIRSFVPIRKPVK